MRQGSNQDPGYEVVYLTSQRAPDATVFLPRIDRFNWNQPRFESRKFTTGSLFSPSFFYFLFFLFAIHRSTKIGRISCTLDSESTDKLEKLIDQDFYLFIYNSTCTILFKIERTSCSLDLVQNSQINCRN